jgi:predicted amidophosphoribosyltransferase
LVRSLGGLLLDLLAPPACLACGTERMRTMSLCERCLHLIRPSPPSPCGRCAGPLGPAAPDSACVACDELRPRFASCVAAGLYPGLLGELIRRGKYGRDRLLAEPLGRLLAAAVAPSRDWIALDVVLPAPPSRTRTRERGFHLAGLLAERVARELGVPLRTTWLHRLGDPPPQASLPRSERVTAARGTVAVEERAERRLAGASVLLVDDVLTTGSTADACARVLLTAGVREVHVAVVARA